MVGTTLVGRYRLLRLLGMGGFGKTYLAADEQEGNGLCVVKHLTPGSQSPEFMVTARRLFDAEAKALGRLGQHDRIPQLLDAFEAGGEFYLVQDYIEGQPLSDLWRSGQPLPEAEVIELLRDVLTTLAFIHEQQVIHRDIKPSNLMRRQDGKIALIDFGAVKEITTEIQTASLGQPTVSIGTQGYAPAEQLAGRPRYSSDLYALGMTAIQALTGRPPNDLPEHPDTGEILWQGAAPPLSPGLGIWLNRLTQPSIYRRYRTAQDALADLDILPTLTAPESWDGMETSLGPSSLTQRVPWGGGIAALAMTAIVLGIHQVGGWVPLELMVYDRLHQQQTPTGPDPRLLVVEITETDLQQLQQPTPSDQTVASAIAQLQIHQPRVIGLDLHRDLPQGEGQAELLTALNAPNVVAITKLGDRVEDTIPPPASVPPERVGFNDLIVDSDGVIRRNLLLASTGNDADSPVMYSFALRLALQYLAAVDITLDSSPDNSAYFALAGTTFYPLSRTFGGYQAIDDAGYQVALRYGTGPTVARRLSLGDLLAGEFEPDWIRDRIVLIGTTAASAKDLFYTPYSRGATTDQDHLMAGVMLHAHMTHQILAVALDGQRLPWSWPDGAEIAWILALSTAGGLWGSRCQRLLWLGIVTGVGLGLAIGIPILIFTQGGWLPLLPGSVALLGSILGATLHRSLGAQAFSPTRIAPVLPPPPNPPEGQIIPRR
ncbi:CHASE2 domain-containing protein [Leptolyngbya sp. PCC 6406]|uniref:CHASE2 domain-containing protein n=1 Tax=Leptolyngbya sp. PCC 6406 TaxID=1173264 RepID=UPI0002ACF4B9|nr:CHASE2 domain-containing protein [Leptolyngbya sp. PCC 6406]